MVESPHDLVVARSCEVQDSKRRDVIQLLKDYRAWHSGGGGALALEDSHLRSAQYGPAGYTETGKEFPPHHRERLEESFGALEHALTLLKNLPPPDNAAYFVLLAPYLGDPGDPSLVDLWRQNPEDQRPYWVDLGVSWLAYFLRRTPLYPVYPKLMSKRAESRMEHQNAEICAAFRRAKAGGFSEREAAAYVAEKFGVLPSRVEKILEFREEHKPELCAFGDCERRVERGNLCMKHYKWERRNKKKRNS